jgi:chromosomal replication initiator protein
LQSRRGIHPRRVRVKEARGVDRALAESYIARRDDRISVAKRWWDSGDRLGLSFKTRQAFFQGRRMTRLAPNIRDALLAYLRQNHPGLCRHWFDQIVPLEISNMTLKLLVRERVQLKYLQRCCVEPFTDAAREVTDRLVTVRFVGEEDAEDNGRRGDSMGDGAGAEGPAERRLRESMLPDDMLLSPDYTFENFVVGPSNRLAHAAALAVAAKPGRAYNPLFIHGGVGLGKTHLLQAVCQAVLAAKDRARIYYISCDDFTMQFMDAVQAGQMSGFRQRFRSIEMLVIDDIHDLSKKDRSQEEFFHTFNALHQSGSQLILSSDAPPNEIPDLEERLVSRFNSGLVAPLDRPCYETRAAIVRSKSALRNVDMPEEVSTYVAARIDSNIRELEGAIQRIQALAHSENLQITLALAKKALSDEPAGLDPAKPTIQQIIDTVTGYYDIKVTDLMSKRRHKSVALPRQVCMWLARQHTRYSLEEIGGYFGGRDHTTVIHAVRTVGSKRKNDPSLDGDVARLERQLLKTDPERPSTSV